MNSNENQKRAPQMSRDLDELSSGPEPVHALGATQCRTTCLLAVALLFLAVMVQAEVFYENPVIPGDHPDPSIIRVGKDYWATSTSSEWGPQFPLLHSTDRVNWELSGSVFPQRPAWAIGNFWAPEISEFKGRFFVYYVARARGGPLSVAVATADKPSGPYLDRGPIVAQEDGSIDPVPATNENGDRYLVWKQDGNSRGMPTPIWAQRLNDDGTQLIGPPKELIRNDAPWEGALVEGPFILKRGGWFYLFYSGNGCCGEGCKYALGVARSRALLGPWEKNPANPILSGNQTWKCPGHGSIVTDERGRYWFLYHAYSTDGSIYTGREAMLDEVTFGADDWPEINHGQGPSVRALSPYGVSQRKADIGFSDDFKERELRAGWQWPQDRVPAYRLEAGHLLLGVGGRTNSLVGAVLARPTTTADYVASTVVETRNLKPGWAVGLCAFGDSHNAMGLAVTRKGLIAWRRDKGAHRRLAGPQAMPGEKIYLRLTAGRGYRFRLSASTDGDTWKDVGEALETKNLPPWDRSVRVALTAGGAPDAEGCFDSFSLQPLTAASKGQTER
jgi:beta-xylosidase